MPGRDIADVLLRQRDLGRDRIEPVNGGEKIAPVHVLPDQVPKLTLGRGHDAGDGAGNLREAQLLLEEAPLRLSTGHLGLHRLDLLAAGARA